MSRLLIHIGYHKTGTTWLQRRLFPRTDLGLTLSHAKAAVVGPLITPNALDFDPVACRAAFEPELRAAWSASLLPVISHERLSGEVHIGGRDSRDTAERLRATFPEARVLIGIREQREMIGSIYAQFVKGSGAWSLSHYLNPPVRAAVRFKYGHFDPDHFRYDRLIAHYQRLFGRDGVVVLPYESFRADPVAFVSDLLRSAGLGVDPGTLASLPFDERVNRSLSVLGTAFKRRLNILCGPRTGFNTTPLWPGDHARNMRLRDLAFRVDRRLPDSWKKAAEARVRKRIADQFAGYYADSNARTAALTGLDLASLGYDLPGGR